MWKQSLRGWLVCGLLLSLIFVVGLVVRRMLGRMHENPPSVGGAPAAAVALAARLPWRGTLLSVPAASLWKAHPAQLGQQFLNSSNHFMGAPPTENAVAVGDRAILSIGTAAGSFCSLGLVRVLKRDEQGNVILKGLFGNPHLSRMEQDAEGRGEALFAQVNAVERSVQGGGGDGGGKSAQAMNLAIPRCEMWTALPLPVQTLTLISGQKHALPLAGVAAIEVEKGAASQAPILALEADPLRPRVHVVALRPGKAALQLQLLGGQKPVRVQVEVSAVRSKNHSRFASSRGVVEKKTTGTSKRPGHLLQKWESSR